MRRAAVLALSLAAALAPTACNAPRVPEREADSPLPAGHVLVYAQDFEDPGALSELWCSEPAAWRTGTMDPWAAPFLGPRTWLRVEPPVEGPQFAYTPPVRAPHRVALVRGFRVGDFVLEVDALSTGRSYGHRDLCLFLGFEGLDRMLYVHLAPEPDAHACNVFTVDEAPRRALAPVPATGTPWEDGHWYRLRVERCLADGTLRVLRDGQLLFDLVEHGHAVGHVGLGTFDDSGGFTRLRVWAPKTFPPAFEDDPFRAAREDPGPWPDLRPAGAIR